MELSELCFEDRTAAKRDAEIRNDWSAALGSGKRIEDISADIGWAFTDEDIKELAWLHKECIHRKKIEQLLIECNLISVAFDLRDGRYIEYF